MAGIRIRNTDLSFLIAGMQIVLMLNTMFGIFDNLSDRNDVYKVNIKQ